MSFLEVRPCHVSVRGRDESNGDATEQGDYIMGWVLREIFPCVLFERTKKSALATGNSFALSQLRAGYAGRNPLR